MISIFNVNLSFQTVAAGPVTDKAAFEYENLEYVHDHKKVMIIGACCVSLIL